MAQQASGAEIVVGWTDSANLPFYQPNADGSPGGFAPELARILASETGLPLRFRQYDTEGDLVAAQAQGETNLLPGTADLPALRLTNKFSARVGTTRVRLAVHIDDVAKINTDSLSDLRIGVVSPATGHATSTIGEQNTIVEFTSFGDAVLSVLAKQTDAILTTDSLVYGMSHATRLDDRLVVVGAPFAEFERFVAVHDDSAGDLLRPVSAALARLEADGRLETLRQRFFISVPEPSPDVLKVGVSNFPPYTIIGRNGEYSGYGVESLKVLADRAGLTLELISVTNDEWAEGPGPGRYDILPEMSKNAKRAEKMDFTVPLEVAEFTVFYRDGDQEVAGITDLRSRDVGVLNVGITPGLAEEHGLDATRYNSPQELLDALLEGEVSAVIFLKSAFQNLLADQGQTRNIRMVSPSILTTERAIALRFGLGGVRERLNAQIPTFLASQQYRSLRQKYFSGTSFWSPERQRLALIAGLIGGIALLVYSYMNLRARRLADRLNAQTQAISSRLTAVMNAAESGILGFDRKHHVAVANPKALHILGGADRAQPFDWPDEIKFVDPQDMKPFEASRNPINRALVGQTLKVESAIMTRSEGVDPRYVRLSSASLDAEASPDIGTVVIIDDVSEQERNRQQVERSSRLDALGQLTGGIAHDFNNLLATIEYAIQLAQGTDDAEARQGYHTTALNSVRRGANLTNRLLAFAKRQPGLAKSALVDDVLADFAELARPTIEENIKLKFLTDDNDLWVFGDVAQLENALLNLVLNSRDAMLRSGKGDSIIIKARGVAEIEADKALLEEDPHSYIAKGLHQEHADARAREDGFAYRYVEIAVTDNGPGMAEEVMRRAIDPFFTTKDTNSGTGLGLSMVYGFVQQANGELRIYSEVGHGTTVRLILPRGTREGARENPVERLPIPRGIGQTVLVVEDEAALLNMMRDIVGSLGYRVEAASNGQDALDRIKSGDTIDLLLTDVVMPGGLGGFDLARSARKLRPDLPVIYMSGYTGFSPEEMGDVVAPLVQKPSPPNIIALTIDNALREEPQRRLNVR